MSLITPAYMQIQKELHAEGKYGLFRGNWDGLVKKAMEKYGFTSCLDYGCGQGFLKQSLGDCVSEYDPCLDGKDADPQPADLVVCTDVLEHIEPDCLDDVLYHIRSKLKGENSRLLFSVALLPAEKTLSDGRNAHLILKSADWWKGKLQHYFRITEANETDALFSGLAQRALAFGKIKAIAALTTDERNDHTRRNVTRTDKRIPETPVAAHGGKIVLACYGPSLEQTLETVREQQDMGGFVVSVSGAHDYLIGNGVVPDYHVECDPRAHKADMLNFPQRATKYLMASCCHPSVIDKLADYDMTLWHMLNGEDTTTIRQILSEEYATLIPGGGSVGLRCLPLFYYLGYREFNIHGMDCSFGAKGRHAGPHTGKPVEEQAVRPKVNMCFGEAVWSEKEYQSAPIMVLYANQFAKDIREGRFPGARITLHGDGLLSEIMRLEGLQRQSLAQAADAFGYELKPKASNDYFSMNEADVDQYQKENAA